MDYTPGPPPDLPALKWGRDNESVAAEELKKEVEVNHSDVGIKEVGILMYPVRPFMAATPDKCASCSCCCLRLVEIKYPYSLRNLKVAEAMKIDRKFYLDKDDQLKENSLYYFQVQFQLMCANDPTTSVIFLFLSHLSHRLCKFIARWSQIK